MNRYAWRLALIATCLSFLSLGAGVASAVTVFFDTDTGVMEVNGAAATTLNGTPVQSSVLATPDGQIMQFRFLGDFVLNSSDQVAAGGLRPLSLFAGNDVNIASGALLNFNAISSSARLGGGAGGAPAVGAAGGTNGTGGATGGAGGAGGAGAVFIPSVTNAEAGDPGLQGSSGSNGSVGPTGNFGQQGGAGFANLDGVRPGGNGGTGGAVGVQGFFVSGSGGGEPGANAFVGQGGGGQGGTRGNDGKNGFDGGVGGPGGSGIGGKNDVTGFVLSGGAGGGSGGSGGSGGGGGGGSTGGGGGGGGGGGIGAIIILEAGADGGQGGTGGTGGNGGLGGVGATSARGGAGGGAIEIAAQGRLNFAGTITVRGAAPGLALNPPNPQAGFPGATGESGAPGEDSLTGLGGGGGDGGDGGNGGIGGTGGRGGPGGLGGGGAGGTVLFRTPLLNAAGGTIDTSGGVAFSGGGNGRYLVAENGFFAPNVGNIVGARREDFFNQGSSGLNPHIHIQGGATVTSNVIGLVGGADVYGLKEGITADDPFFDAVRAGAPPGAFAALIRSSDGPSPGEKYFLQDLVMLVNLTDAPLSDPRLGIGASTESFRTPLLLRGFTRNPDFGGAGPVLLGDLPAKGVYATIVPTENSGNLEVTASFASTFEPGVLFNSLTVHYYGRETDFDGDFDNDNDVDGADFLVWQRAVGKPAGTLLNDPTGAAIGAPQLGVWKSNFGQPPPPVVAVAEPTAATLLLAGCLAACRPVRRRRRLLMGPL